MILVDVLVPDLKTGKPRCRMASSVSLAELHAFARHLQVRRHWFIYGDGSTPHYDITESVRKRACKKGAREVTGQEMIRLCAGRTWAT